MHGPRVISARLAGAAIVTVLWAAAGCSLVTRFDRPIAADDASATDAGSTDGGARDGGELSPDAPDGSELDASALDASALDASALDASALDASALDASALDASSSDAGPFDVGLDALACDGTTPDCLGICGGGHVLNGCGACVLDSASQPDFESARESFGYLIADGDWQSFVPLRTGDLTRIEVEHTSGTATGVTVEIHAEHSGGALLAARTVTLSGVTSITFDPPAPVVAGATYVVVLHFASTDLTMQGASYGHAYLLHYNPDGSIWLRTHVRPCGT